MRQLRLQIALILIVFAVSATSIRKWPWSAWGSHDDVKAIDHNADIFLDIQDDLDGQTDDPFSLLEAKYRYHPDLATSADAVALNPFRDLDLYKKAPANSKPDFAKKNDYVKFNRDAHYCDMVDYENIKNPHNWMTKFVSSDYPWKIIKKFVVKEYGLDKTQLMRPILDHDLSYNISLFLLHRGNFGFLHRMGIKDLCYTQSYAVVNGLKGLTWKKGFAENFFNYSEKYKNEPNCIQAESFFPRTYLLDDKEQCKAWFKVVNSEAYEEKKKKQPLQYLIKMSDGVDEGKGVFLLTQSYEEDIKKKYMNGEMCGVKKDKLLAQYYISNPLLLDHTHKFDFRMHAFIGSTDPLMVYFRDGIVRVSLQEYNIASHDLKNHLTNVHVSQSIVEAEKDPKKHQELLDYQVQSLQQFQAYLLREGLITDPNWIENYLRPQFMKATAHIIRMTKHSYTKRAGLFRLLGVDFMIDENLKVWFIEVNFYPMLFRTRPDVWQNTMDLVKEMVDIEYGLLRSRMKKVSKFMKSYIRACMLDHTDCNKDEWREAFFKINKDGMDPEFAPPSSNKWQLIMDLGKKGKDAYFGHLDESCFKNGDD